MPRIAELPRVACVAERIVENPRTITLALDAKLSCHPGQFAMLWLPGLDEKPFSVACDDPLAFAVCRVGPFSEALQELAVGERLWVRGPFGRGFRAEARTPLLVGGGYGAAPLWFLARRLLAPPPGATGPAQGRQRPRRLSVALGAKSSADLLFAGRFAALGCTVILATEDGSAGTRGLVTEVAKALLEQGVTDRIYGCGPEGMLDALARLARERSVPAELCYEAYMRCGIGVCGSCAHGARLVCLDGPVFDV